MTMIIDGSDGLTFPDNTLQTAGVPSPGTAGNVLQSNGTIWTSVANPPAFVSGTLMLFQQTSAPTGWTKQTTHNDKALRVVSGSASTGGSVGFTTAFASQAVNGSIANTTAGGSVGVSLSSGGSVSNTTLGTNEIPAHNHVFRLEAQGTNNTTGNYNRGNGNLLYSPLTNNTGGGGSHGHGFTNPSYSGSFTGSAHNHTFTGTAINLAVSYVDLIIASKD